MKSPVVFAASMIALFASTPSSAKPPLPNDFAEGITLTAKGSQPLLELPVPDKVYATVTQWNLADVRVFNANGDVVPHAFCNDPAAGSSIELNDVPVYSVDTPRSSTASHSNIHLHTADGTLLTVDSADSGNNPHAFRSNASYVLDLRKVEHDINGVQLDWSLPSGASETSVSVLSSNDLAHWQTIVTNAKLLRAISSDHHVLYLSRIGLPAARYQYLRIEPAGDVLMINSAKVEHQVAPTPPQPIWYSAGAPYGSDDPHQLRYENARHASVSLLRITPHIENSSMHVTVQSRDREDHAWQTQWAGEVFDVRFNDQNRHNDSIVINSTAAGEWRLLFPDNTEPPASAPSFEFGYLPARLRFLAQGNGPYLLAYGNAQVTTTSAQRCDDLLASINLTDKHALIGSVVIGATQLFAGKEALVIKKKIPTRTLLLWGILLIGAAIIMKMAFSLLKNSKQQNQE